jgi:hypothetical protein
MLSRVWHVRSLVLLSGAQGMPEECCVLVSEVVMQGCVCAIPLPNCELYHRLSSADVVY